MYQDYKQEEHWDAHYKKREHALLNYDGWLDKYMPLWEKGCQIIDLGCGSGSDTDVLIKNGYNVCAVDFSEEALRIMKGLVPDAISYKLDITKKLPFKSDSFDVVVADLSLHYFEWELTKEIVAEIRRVLKNGGMIAARFNSDKDHGFGANSGNLIEPGLRFVDGRTKRFFSENDINKLFQGWDTFVKKENVTERYGKKKAYWEYAAYNQKKVGCGAIVGRFQIFHNGHLKYLRKTLQYCDKLIIGISNPDPWCMRETKVAPHRNQLSANPLTYYARMKMLQCVCREEGIVNERYDIIPVPLDIPERMSYYIPKETIIYLTVHDDWSLVKKQRFEEAGYQTRVIIDEYGCERLSSTMIREKISRNEDYRKYVPESVFWYLEKNTLIEKIRNSY